MTLHVDVAVDPALRLPLARERARELAERVLRAEGARRAVLSLTFLPDKQMAALNRRHLGHAGPTDVIAFPLAAPAAMAPMGGDVYVGAESARTNARLAGVTWREELARLVVHGVLHVLGHDHPAGEARLHSSMWARQERLLGRLFAAPVRAR